MQNSEFVDEAHIPDADFSIILSAEKMLKRRLGCSSTAGGEFVDQLSSSYPGHVHVFHVSDSDEVADSYCSVF